jgi:hypothetical protein
MLILASYRNASSSFGLPIKRLVSRVIDATRHERPIVAEKRSDALPSECRLCGFALLVSGIAKVFYLLASLGRSRIMD